jgi:hypothetical protein
MWQRQLRTPSALQEWERVAMHRLPSIFVGLGHIERRGERDVDDLRGVVAVTHHRGG